MTKTTNEKLVDAVLEYLAAAGGAESVSYLLRSLREDGWRGFSCISAFEALLERLGFTLRKGRNNRGQWRTEVTL